MKQRLLSLLVLLFSANVMANTSCSATLSDEQLLTLKASQFQPATGQDVNQLAIALLACVGHVNPVIRDGVVYEAYQHWLRNAQLDSVTIKQLFNVLLANLENSSSDPEQFRTAFSALIFSEVIRVDRIQPYLDTVERQRAVDKTADFMKGIHDYRGFNNQEGWRHSVAHTADIILQLALNDAITPVQGQTLLSAIMSQVSPAQHFYHFGEPKRLALPVLYLLLKSKIDSALLIAQLQAIAAPTPFANWQAAYQSEQGLAKLHNSRSFLEQMYVLANSSQNAQLQALVPEIEAMLKSIN